MYSLVTDKVLKKTKVCLPGLGLEKHPPMVGPGSTDTEEGTERGGKVGEVRSNPEGWLQGRKVTITQNRVYEMLLVRGCHHTRQLPHMICTDEEDGHAHTQRDSSVRCDNRMKSILKGDGLLFIHSHVTIPYNLKPLKLLPVSCVFDVTSVPPCKDVVYH